MQFLYRDGTDAHFMDSESYEQLPIPEAKLADALRWMKDSEEFELLYIDDEPADVQLPSAIDLTVTETEPGVRGDTASGGGTKPGTLQTGARIQVPLFVNIGDAVRVDGRADVCSAWEPGWRRSFRLTPTPSRARWPSSYVSPRTSLPS